MQDTIFFGYGDSKGRISLASNRKFFSVSKKILGSDGGGLLGRSDRGRSGFQGVIVEVDGAKG